MQQRQIFGLIVRITGFTILVLSWNGLFYVVAKLLGIPVPSRIVGIAGDVWLISFYLVTGVAIIRGADWIVHFAYSSKENISS